jgi:hypothetical protein
MTDGFERRDIIQGIGLFAGRRCHFDPPPRAGDLPFRFGRNIRTWEDSK